MINGGYRMTQTLDEIGELMWQVLTHNVMDRKYPIDDLRVMVHEYRGDRKRLAETILEAFAEASSYSMDGMDDEVETDAFASMRHGIRHAHYRA